MQQDSQHVLSSYEELLRRPDFVLEPRCYPTIVGFRGAGGKPETAVEFLSDGYVGEGDDACVWRALSGASSFKLLVCNAGYPQMASLVCQWLRLANDDRSSSQHANESSKPAGPSCSYDGPSTSRPSGPNQLDEFHFLKEFTKQKFDSEKLAGVFSRCGRCNGHLRSACRFKDSRGSCWLSAPHQKKRCNVLPADAGTAGNLLPGWRT